MILASLFALLAAADAPPPAQAKTARCVVTVASGARYAGPCRFTPERGGSFAVERTDGKPIVDDVSMISVAIVEPGIADVRGLTAEGINSRWGEARRVARDRACWAGSDFRVCAY